MPLRVGAGSELQTPVPGAAAPEFLPLPSQPAQAGPLSQGGRE